MTNTVKDFNFTSDHSGTVFSDNAAYIQKVLSDAYASEGRGKAPKIQFVGSTLYGFDAYIIPFNFARVRRRFVYRTQRQKHSVVIFPTFVGMSNLKHKSQFTHVHGNWAWNK